ncbi:MAG: nuclease-related domain-containing protein [Gammaproteobacteria bacterium]
MKSPIKAKPLNNPGESLDKQIQNVLYDEIFTYGLLAVFFIILAGLEWWRLYAKMPPSPITYTFVATIIVIYTAWKIRSAFKKVKNLKQGLDGEKAVGQFLEKLREQGAQVFHDVPGEGFNLDHVVIHPSGIYVIETKTLSKPDRGEAKLIYDGERVLKNGFEMDRNAVVQVSAGRSWLAEVLKSSTGKSFPIRPVVVYPGWFIQPTAEAKNSDVWVLNPKALPAFIANSKQRLTPEEVHLCKHHLTKHIQAALP